MAHKKQIFKISILKSLLGEENSCVYLVPTTRILALPPFFLNDMKSGILYLLSNMLKKYDRTLEGIVIGYQNIKVLMDENTGIIPMGASETEVNISVEFYIFQPKIGSLLQGVVNKKSSSHIGCLVHRYFNATILKPEDVDFDDWICQDFNVDDKIIFKVKDLDFTLIPPFIEGDVEEEFIKQVKSNFKKRIDVTNDCENNVNQKRLVFSPEKEVEDLDSKQFTSSNLSKELNINDKHSKKKKKKDKKKEENEKHDSSKAVTSNLSKTLGELEPIECKKLNNFVKLDKIEDNNKGEAEEPHLESSNIELNESLDVNKFIPSNSSKEFKKKKKKDKKDKKKEENKKHEESSKAITSKTLEKSELNKDLNSFVNLDKIIDNKKTETKETHTESSKRELGISSNEAEDDIFYSTQLDFNLPKKMRISCCSPITKNTSFEEQNDKQDLNNQTESPEKRKNKDSKRKADSVKSRTGSKKQKTSYSDKEKTSNDDVMSIVQTMMEEACGKQISHDVTEELNKSGREKSKKRKKENEEVKTEETVKVDSLLDELRKREMERVKEELNVSGKEKKVKKKKKEKEKSGENGMEFSVQNIMENLLKEEMNRIKDETIDDKKCEVKRESEEKEKKKKKNVVNTEGDISGVETHNSLFEKLLQDAKSAVDVEEDKCLTLPIVKKSKKKKKNSVDNLNYLAKTPKKIVNGNSEQSNASSTAREKKKVLPHANIPTKIVTECNNEKEKILQEQESLYERLLGEAKSSIQSSG